MEKDNNMLQDILVFLFILVCINGEGPYYDAGYLSVSSDNIILYRYVLMEKDSNMMLDILVFLLTIPYCTGMH